MPVVLEKPLYKSSEGALFSTGAFVIFSSIHCVGSNNIMVKRQANLSLTSFQSMGIETSMVGKEKSVSMRSVESFSSNSSSLCSTDPAMRRTTSRHHKLKAQGRTIDEKTEMDCDLRVTFSPMISEVVCEVRNREDFNDAEKLELFLTLDDMAKIKYDAKYITKYYRVKEKRTIDSLDQVYTEAMCRSTYFTSYEEFLRFIRNDDGEFEQIVAQLNPWCRSTKLSGRGLERYCSQKQRSERQSFSSECRAAVVRLSKSEAVSAEEVAAFYHEYSRGNTIYARLMGRGDEIAAANVHIDSKSEFVVQPKNLLEYSQQISCGRGVTNLNIREQATTKREIDESRAGYATDDTNYNKVDAHCHMDTSNSKRLSMDRRQLFAMQRQSSSARLIVRLSNRAIETRLSNRSLDTI